MRASTIASLLLAVIGIDTIAIADTAGRACGQVLVDTSAVGSSEIAVFTATSSDECCVKCATTDDCKLFTFGDARKGVGNTYHLLRNATGTEAVESTYLLATGDVVERLSDVESMDTCCAKCAEASKCALFSYGGAWKGKGPECVLLASFASGEYAGPGGFIYTTATMSDYAGPDVQVVSTSPTPSANNGSIPSLSPSPSPNSGKPPSTPAPAPTTSGPALAPATSKPQC